MPDRTPENARENTTDCSRAYGNHLVPRKVGWVVRVVVFDEEVLLDRSGQHSGLQSTQPLEPGVSRGDGPHSHGVKEVHVFRR